MKITSKDLLRKLRDLARPWLTGSQAFSSKFYELIQEIYPVHASHSGNERLRFNIIIPTANPAKIYGGLATALKIAQEIIDGLPNKSDIRVIITSDAVDRHSVSEVSRRLGKTFVISRPNEDIVGFVAIDLYQHRCDPISIRKNDIFFATAWWTADLGFRLIARQQIMFNHSLDLIYLIQDYEPGFYPWSNKYALSEATYRHESRTLALINSEELFNYMCNRYKFKASFLIPYEINETIKKNLRVCQKEKIILVYGRPSVHRNCFEIILEGLRLWQLRSPHLNIKFQIKFVGEYFSNALISELENASVLGKLSLVEYAELLSRSSIGISLMLSPHPSYPPLEMAYSGAITISNRYESKDLNLRSKNFISLDNISPTSIADALDTAISIITSGADIELHTIRSLESSDKTFSVSEISKKLFD